MDHPALTCNKNNNVMTQLRCDVKINDLFYHEFAENQIV